MFATDQVPGVHYQSVDAGSPPVAPLRTDIAGFVGIAERGPVDVPVPVESWQQFASWFGRPVPEGYLALAVRGFLENGGRRCWVVRVASDDPLTGSAAAQVLVEGAPAGAPPGVGEPVWRVVASSPGTWGDQLSCRIRQTRTAQVHTEAHDPEGRWSRVPRVAGFDRASLVRITQAGSTRVLLRTVSALDAVSARLWWVHPEPGAGLPYDAPVVGFDPGRPLLLESVDHLLLVQERGRLVRVHEHLSTVPEHPRYGPALLGATASPLDPVTGRSRVAPPEPVVVEELRAAPSAGPGALATLVVDPAAWVGLTGGRAGLAALREGDLVGEPLAPDDDADAVARKRRGLRALEGIEEVGLLAVPDVLVHPDEPHPTAAPPVVCVPDPCLDEPVVGVLAPPGTTADLPPVFDVEQVYRVQSEMVLQAERQRDRVALLDAPLEVSLDPVAGVRGVLDWRGRFDSAYAALVWPWLVVADPLAEGPGAGSGGPGRDGLRLLPAAGHVAGLVAATDLETGCHRAPANRPVRWALGPSLVVGEEHHAVLNTAGVDVLRTVGGRGLRLLGSRTLSSDPDWRQLPVRRLVSMVEEALEAGLQWAVFEPNGFLTRARATMTATFLLDSLHEAGMLAGSVPEESFYVRCDLDNNPPEQREQGQLVVEVGVAPAQPLEFVVLRVGRVGASLEVREAGSWTPAGAGVGTGA